ncbi:hypothetical protein MHYP_G00350370 [Metynnis hypsauchen]
MEDELQDLRDLVMQLRAENERLRQECAEVSVPASPRPIAPISSPSRSSPPPCVPTERLVYIPRERKCPVFHGNMGIGIVEWVEEVQASMRARRLAPVEEAYFIYDHLEGEAKDEIRYRSRREREDPEKIQASYNRPGEGPVSSVLQSHISEGEGLVSPQVRLIDQQVTSQLVGTCPYLTVNIGGIDVKCLLDTGSMVSTLTETFFSQHFKETPQSCRWLQLKAANGLDIPYLGYLELDVTVFDKVICNRGILIVKDPPGSSHSIEVPGVLDMNVIRECYEELFGQYGPLLFNLPCIRQTPKVLQQALQCCHMVHPKARQLSGVAKLRARHSPLGILSCVQIVSLPASISEVMKEPEERAVTTASCSQQVPVGDPSGVIDGIDLSALSELEKGKVRALLQEYRSVFAVHEGDLGCTDLLAHEIPLLDEVIRESCSPYASPIVLVKKKDGSLRMCVDYRQLNSKTRKDAFPLPQIEESLDALSGAKWFSTLDLAKEHLERLASVLSRLQREGLKVKLEKCCFFKTKVKYLGHVISKDGVATDPDKISAVSNWAQPQTVSDLRSFLGFASYYRRFVQGFSKLAAPLHQAVAELSTKGVKRNHVGTLEGAWTEQCKQSFNELKACLVTAPVLAYANFSQPFILEIDASYPGLGAVLSQEYDGKVRPIAYASRALTPPERNMSNYSSMKLEFLALKWAMTEVSGVFAWQHQTFEVEPGLVRPGIAVPDVLRCSANVNNVAIQAVVAALPSRSSADLAQLQLEDPIGSFLHFWQARRSPTRVERRALAHPVMELLHQRERIFQQSGLLYRRGFFSRRGRGISSASPASMFKRRGVATPSSGSWASRCGAHYGVGKTALLLAWYVPTHQRMVSTM